MTGRAAMAALSLLASSANAQDAAPQCLVEAVVLGAGQDAGAPQIGNGRDKGPRLLPSSLAVIDRENGERFLFDATPAITEQLALLDSIEPSIATLDGIFLTHAHIGHYLGLAYLGREAANANGVPVFARSRMLQFLRDNGPWSQLVDLENVQLIQLRRESFVELSDRVGVSSMEVPHRDEYSETVGFKIETSGKSLLYLPDFDGWPDLGNEPEKEDKDRILMLDILAQLELVDHAFIDATFWDDNELPGRDMTQIPHPRVTETMDLLQSAYPENRAQVHFIHYNHTNPIRDPESAESRQVRDRGFKIARRGDRICLD